MLWLVGPPCLAQGTSLHHRLLPEPAQCLCREAEQMPIPPLHALTNYPLLMRLPVEGVLLMPISPHHQQPANPNVSFTPPWIHQGSMPLWSHFSSLAVVCQMPRFRLPTPQGTTPTLCTLRPHPLLLRVYVMASDIQPARILAPVSPTS